MRKIFCFALASLLTVACSQVRNARQPQSRSAIPALRVTTDTGTIELGISALDIRVEVTGNIATTTFDIRFSNPLDRDLEGEFDFPLADGQNISRYALEIEGTLREGVVVEKKEARVAFENTVRRKIDPGLVEKTAGNHFRTRVYPIPARGEKRVVIGIEQALSYDGSAYRYALPLRAAFVGKFALAAHVAAPLHAPDLSVNELPGFGFEAADGNYEGALQKGTTALNAVFGFRLPFSESDGPLVFTHTGGDRTFFYAHGLAAPQREVKKNPSSIAVLWDISASAKGRRIAAELEFLEGYLSRIGNATVQLIPFHIRPLPVETFTIANGRSEVLIERLRSFPQDGGTQLGSLDLSGMTAEEAILFSDGLSNIGKSEMVLPKKPVYCVSSAPSADYSGLKFIARETGGALIDLSVLDTQKAVAAITASQQLPFELAADSDAVADLVMHSDAVSGTLSVSGILRADAATLRLRRGKEGAAGYEEKSFSVTRGGRNSIHVPRIWAAMQIGELDMQYEKNRDRITALGKAFSIVTRNTSLLVLDRLEDYLTYRITPPEPLRQAYFAQLKEMTRVETDAKATAMEEAIQSMETLKAWWQNGTVQPKILPAVPLSRDQTIISNNIEGSYLATDSVTTHRFSTAGSQAQTSLSVQDISAADEKNEITADRDDAEASEKRAAAPGIGEPARDIVVSKWKADADYLQVLQKTAVQDRYTRYLGLKKEYGAQPSFFVDVARLFAAGGDTTHALLILSNVAEMKLEDPELLRILGFQLLEMGEKDLAIAAFREVLKLREEEPHSYRDLALALTERGSHAEALSLLYQLITGVWDSRFGDVRGIAINELNGIISAHPGLDVSGIDPRFIFPMPVDIRIVMGWTSNDSDIDLWVTDPSREKCDYTHTATAIGGRMTRDVTQGYGPEEFSLRKAAKGWYEVEANLYGDTRQTLGGPVTITADLYTDFGRPSQKRKRIHFRITEANDVAKIGTLRF